MAAYNVLTITATEKHHEKYCEATTAVVKFL